jgi:hypothetical protein
MTSTRRRQRYEDFPRLPFLTRCIMETLRLWVIVPNGTFRELQCPGPPGAFV